MPGVHVDDILRSPSLFDDGVVDSLGLQQLLVHIETAYSIEVGEEELVPDNFETIRGVAMLVDKLLAN